MLLSQAWISRGKKPGHWEGAGPSHRADVPGRLEPGRRGGFGELMEGRAEGIEGRCWEGHREDAGMLTGTRKRGTGCRED